MTFRHHLTGHDRGGGVVVKRATLQCLADRPDPRARTLRVDVAVILSSSPPLVSTCIGLNLTTRPPVRKYRLYQSRTGAVRPGRDRPERGTGAPPRVLEDHLRHFCAGPDMRLVQWDDHLVQSATLESFSARRWLHRRSGLEIKQTPYSCIAGLQAACAVRRLPAAHAGANAARGNPIKP